MIELLAAYSISEILIFVVMLALAIKGFVTFLDWAKDRLRQVFSKEIAEEEKLTNLHSKISYNKEKFEQLSNKQQEFEKTLSDLTDKINLLIESDKYDIKSFITREHHYFCYEKEWIDDYSLECLERRFDCYIDEKGNSFVEDLMKEIRDLPKHPPH